MKAQKNRIVRYEGAEYRFKAGKTVPDDFPKEVMAVAAREGVIETKKLTRAPKQGKSVEVDKTPAVKDSKTSDESVSDETSGEEE